MTKLISLVGQKFGRLTVVSRSDRVSSAGALWDCVCDCGASTVAGSLKLRDGHTKSCGCLKRERLINFKHGLANKDKTYRSWKEMRQRCLNPNSDKWKWYGGRGITICARWDDYENFLADMGERLDGHTIDRIDSDGNYEPSNCRWATAKQQAETNRGCKREGYLPPNKTPDDVISQMRSMRQGGAKVKDIAAHYGKWNSVVSQLINYGGRPCIK